MPDPIRIAVIGGGWATRRRHVPSLLRCPSFAVRGVISRSQDTAKALADKYHLAHCASASDLRGVDWLEDIDALVIATPPQDHAALALQALGLGKHVLVEKPFALSVEEAALVLEAAETSGKTLAVVHNLLHCRAALRLKRALRQGSLGEIKRIAAVYLGNPKRQVPAWTNDLPLGLFFDETPHFYYLLRQLAQGPLTLLHAHGFPSPERAKATPRHVALAYRTDHAIPVTIDCQFDSPLSEWHIVVVGDKALGIVDLFRDIYITIPNDGAHTLPQIVRTSLYAGLQHMAGYLPNGVAYLRNRLDYGNDEVVGRFARAIGGDLSALGGMGMQDAMATLSLQLDAVKALNKNGIK